MTRCQTQSAVAVTGASGFIGGRLVERLVLESAVTVRPLVRNFGRLARLSVLPQGRLEFRVGDLDRPETLRAALAGCEVLVHCAHGTSSSPEQSWKTTVDGTAALLAAARAGEVRRVVHLSTADVYDVGRLREFDEHAPYRAEDPRDLDHTQQKLAAERLALQAEGDDMEVVVLQPTVVYGPWGVQWTTRVLRRLPRESHLLPTGDQGVCNAIYVDDVVEAILLAIETAGLSAARIVVCGAEPVSWGAFYDAFRAMLGLPRPSGPADGGILPAWERELYSGKAVALPSTARRLLGLNASTKLEQGMSLVESWARWMGYLHGAASTTGGGP